jgi:hypothetical protein
MLETVSSSTVRGCVEGHLLPVKTITQAIPNPVPSHFFMGSIMAISQ